MRNRLSAFLYGSGPPCADKRYLFPEGVKAVGDAVDLIAAGKAPRIVQPTEGATYDPLWKVSEGLACESAYVVTHKGFSVYVHCGVNVWLSLERKDSTYGFCSLHSVREVASWLPSSSFQFLALPNGS